MTGDQQRRYIGGIAGTEPLLGVIGIRAEPPKTAAHNNVVFDVV